MNSLKLFFKLVLNFSARRRRGRRRRGCRSRRRRRHRRRGRRRHRLEIHCFKFLKSHTHSFTQKLFSCQKVNQPKNLSLQESLTSFLT